MSELRLLNKTVVVTGGASGIGKATAERFLEEGASSYTLFEYLSDPTTIVGVAPRL